MRWLPLVFVICSCAPPPPPPVVKPPDPDFVLTKRVLETGNCQLTARYTFSLKNLRSQALRVSRWEAAVTTNGEAPQTQDKSLELMLTSQDQTTFEIPVVIDRRCERLQPQSNEQSHAQVSDQASSLPSTLPASAEASEPALRAPLPAFDKVHVEGQLFALAPDELVLAFDDDLDLPGLKPPEVSAHLSAQRYDFGRIDMFLVITLDNPNGFALLINEVGYEVKLAGTSVQFGSALRQEKVREASRSKVEIPLELDQKSPAVAELMKSGRVEFTINLNLAFGALQLPKRHSGTFSF